MALPTLSKTWQFNVNNAQAAQGTALADHRKLLRAIKNALIGFATNAWALRYSCNSTTAGTAGDGVDRWSSDTDLVWANAGTAHSWVVLRQTGIATNFEMLISCEAANGSGNTLTLVISPSAAFTGGSTTARPTATDEIVLISNVAWSGIGSADLSLRWSVMQSTDGQCTRVIICNSGAVSAYWIIDKPANPTTGWSNPSVLFAAAASPTVAVLAGSAAPGRMRSGSTTGNVQMLCEGNNVTLGPIDTTWGNIANEISSEWPMVPIAFASITVGVRGRHGTFQDLWFGSVSVSSGDTYPNDSSNQFAEFGCLILPWNGGSVNLT
jgi:hypothetical protein